MKHPSTIIVGAGAAGLAAAGALSAAGCHVIVLEGRNRIGGRIFTVQDPALKIPIELGAEFIHGTPQATFDLVRAAKLVTYDVPFEHLRKRGPQLTDHPQYISDLRTGMMQLGRLGKRDMSFSDYLVRYRSGKSLARARQTALEFVEGFDAADPERISARSLAQEQESLGDLQHSPQFRLLKGYSSLIDYMRRSLDRQRVRILLQIIVQEIHWKKEKVALICQGRRQPYQADRLLLTLPLGVLQLPPEAAGAVRFFPDLPEKRSEANRLGSGAVVKVILRFQQAFWESSTNSSKGSSMPNMTDAVFLHDPGAALPTWWTARPLRLPILTGWLGGPKALHISGQPPEAIRTMALKSLGGLLGRSPSRLEAMLAGFYYHDWPADPLARGAYSYTTVHGQSAHQKLGKPVDGTLFFAGEATDASGEASTVAGAIASGQRAAKEIIASL